MKRLCVRQLDGRECIAWFDDDEIYRYELQWIWDSSLPLLPICLLNPSTATHEYGDPTVDCLVARAQDMDFGGFDLVNAFAYRATNPKELKKADDPVGPENDKVIAELLDQCATDNAYLFCGWGVPGRFKKRHETIVGMARERGVELRRLDENANGTPKHPLYVKREQWPEVWKPEAAQ